MMQTQTLQLVFLTDNGKTYTINIDNPKVPYDVLSIQDCVNTTLSSGVFKSKNGLLVELKEANFITKNVELIELA
ncbi:MAG: hypothetical protein K0Q49_773 [Haloplasmataceae bacterium]|jgi:hypothetical protein|nr:hypothetical protein [Haloplasmataceae bacterium]